MMRWSSSDGRRAAGLGGRSDAAFGAWEGGMNSLGFGGGSLDHLLRPSFALYRKRVT